jgi:CheY-like chemotaxis protein
VKTGLAKDLPGIHASSHHIYKVVMNLVSNAMEAVETCGTVWLKTDLVQFEKKILKGYEKTRDGSYVRLRVEDTGPGISFRDLDRIFEPFYTKKVLGRSGTGLGLSIVWSIVHDHKGYIQVESGKGRTCFDLFLPVTFDAPGEPPRDKVYTLGDYSGQGQRVLVVDDVKSQQQITSNMLTRLGYQVTVVTSGEAAIDHVRENKVDLVVLDMIMDPGISGLETFQALQRIDPDIRAVIVSGFARTDAVRKAQALGAGPYIKKPYSLQEIGLAIRDALSRGEVKK